MAFHKSFKKTLLYTMRSLKLLIFLLSICFAFKATDVEIIASLSKSFSANNCILSSSIITIDLQSTLKLSRDIKTFFTYIKFSDLIQYLTESDLPDQKTAVALKFQNDSELQIIAKQIKNKVSS